MNEKVKVYSPDLNCVYCHEDLGVGIPSVSCGCGATQHISCVDELGNSNTCGSCNYVFNSPEAKQLGEEHFKKSESLDELVEETTQNLINEKSPDIGTHAKAAGNMLKSAGVTVAKGVGYALFCAAYSPIFALKGWYKVHLGNLNDLDEEDKFMPALGGSALTYGVLASYLLYSYAFANHPASNEEKLVMCSLFGMLGGGLLGGLFSFGVLGTREYVKKTYQKFLDEANNDE